MIDMLDIYAIIIIISGITTFCVAYRKISTMDVTTEDPKINRFSIPEIFSISLVIGACGALVITFMITLTRSWIL